jgi:hypothetical protein
MNAIAAVEVSWFVVTGDNADMVGAVFCGVCEPEPPPPPPQAVTVRAVTASVSTKGVRPMTLDLSFMDALLNYP